jgi:hypothetical protein
MRPTAVSTHYTTDILSKNSPPPQRLSSGVCQVYANKPFVCAPCGLASDTPWSSCVSRNLFTAHAGHVDVTVVSSVHILAMYALYRASRAPKEGALSPSWPNELTIIIIIIIISNYLLCCVSYMRSFSVQFFRLILHELARI